VSFIQQTVFAVTEFVAVASPTDLPQIELGFWVLPVNFVAPVKFKLDWLKKSGVTSFSQMQFSNKHISISQNNPRIFDPGRVAIYGFGLENFTKNVKFSIFFPSGQKNFFGLGPKVLGSKADHPLIYCGSKVSSGRVRAHL